MYSGSKAHFYALSRSPLLKRMASRYGMASPRSFARRFIAGERIEEAIAAARQLQSQGLLLTLDYLGESVASADEAAAATREYARHIDLIIASGIERNLSLKLTQLGIGLGRQLCIDNLRRILDAGREHAFFVRIDMENSPYTEATLDVFETLWAEQYRNVGIVLQACLRRTEGDVRRMNALGARVRLVKGAYKEPEDVALQEKAAVDTAFRRYTRELLDAGIYPAVATHDEAIIGDVIAYATERAIAPERYEFQMLYGIRRDLQASLIARGYRVRIYVPFGQQWFPYFMRRLGERPANVGFVLRSLLRDRG